MAEQQTSVNLIRSYGQRLVPDIRTKLGRRKISPLALSSSLSLAVIAGEFQDVLQRLRWNRDWMKTPGIKVIFGIGLV